MTMNKWNLVIDVSLCNNCAACQIATMDEYAMNDFPGYAARAPKTGATWITIQRFERGQGTQIDVNHLPTLCQHCDSAACGAGADEAIVKRADGVVLIHPQKAKGRRDLVDKCPMGAIHWNDELGLPQAWTFDAHLLDAGWKQPRCAHACPSGAMVAHHVPDSQMQRMVSTEGLQVLAKVASHRPRVYYKHLDRITHRFVAGTVVGLLDGKLACLAGAQVQLTGPQGFSMRCTTDAFGDFKFEPLPAQDMAYALTIAMEGFASRQTALRSIEPGSSLGEVELVRASWPGHGSTSPSALSARDLISPSVDSQFDQPPPSALYSVTPLLSCANWVLISAWRAL